MVKCTHSNAKGSASKLVLDQRVSCTNNSVARRIFHARGAWIEGLGLSHWKKPHGGNSHSKGGTKMCWQASSIRWQIKGGCK